MRPAQTNNDVSPDDLSLVAARRLVAYEEAKAAGNGIPFVRPVEASAGEPLASDLACVDLLHRVWPDFDLPPQVDDACLPTKTLGDFRLIRELGRGGMGTVYEAEQLSMGRHVALKVLPFAALVDDKSLQRFRNEVRAAAALDHPHIVSVYSVGEERGVHFYAMQLIRGQTLADLIHAVANESHGHRQPVPLPTNEGISATMRRRSTRPSARRRSTKHEQRPAISTAADSRRARRSSIARPPDSASKRPRPCSMPTTRACLHRDIKPGNLMLDGEGKLYVTDFGLARIEADAGLTMTGDIIGTLRYMAPEQALAKRVVIDHRADVYSLGRNALRTAHSAAGLRRDRPLGAA